MAWSTPIARVVSYAFPPDLEYLSETWMRWSNRSRSCEKVAFSFKTRPTRLRTCSSSSRISSASARSTMLSTNPSPSVSLTWRSTGFSSQWLQVSWSRAGIVISSFAISASTISLISFSAMLNMAQDRVGNGQPKRYLSACDRSLWLLFLAYAVLEPWVERAIWLERNSVNLEVGMFFLSFRCSLFRFAAETLTSPSDDPCW
ncbi:hypothetical protein C8R46DRAFT_1110989 [Mycena filopes]|nr:hypothetical protein C8R46DRAFT_1110989 [Mycena filopes]